MLMHDVTAESPDSIVSQGTILSRNSPGLIMNEGNLIIQQVSKESAGIYDSFSDVGEIRVYRRADFQSGSRVLKKVF